MRDVLEANAAAGLPGIDVSASQGKFLNIMALVRGAKRILEVGTLGGYSTIWLARALPADGKLISLEVEPKHAQVAQSNIERAGLSRVVEIRIGKALESLERLHEETSGPFDLVFIDADKANNPNYFAWALKLTKKGSMIVVDNVVRRGAIVEPASQGAGVRGTRALYEMIAGEPSITATALQTVGTKGWDGFILAVVI
jgi:predicted O-methyltransferase YrrM